MKVAHGHRVGERHGAAKAAADGKRQQNAGDDADENRGAGGANEQGPGVVELSGGLVLGLIHGFGFEGVDSLDLPHEFILHIARLVYGQPSCLHQAVLLDKLAHFVLQLIPFHQGWRQPSHYLPDVIGCDVLQGLELLEEQGPMFQKLFLVFPDLIRRGRHEHVFLPGDDIRHR